MASVDARSIGFTATGLTAGTTPQFYVTATNASGESSNSNTVSAAIPALLQNVGAVFDTSTASNVVSWTPDNTAIGYLIGRTPDDGSSGMVLIATVSGSDSYTDMTDDPTQSYTYTVEPYYSNPPPTTMDGDGTGAPASTDNATGTIQAFKATVGATTIDGVTVNFSWTYQGSTTGLELEEMDPTLPGTNFKWVQSPGGRTASVEGLQPGFRIN
jgi:hypothetical protein